MLSSYDIFMLVILVVAAIRGAIKGIVWQLAVIGSILLCFAFSGTGSVFIAPMLPLQPPLNRWMAMLILYIVLSFAAFGIARLLHNWIEKMKFKEYDRHLGFLFGAVKGLILCLVCTFFVVTISDGYRQSVMKSRSGHAAAIIMDRLHPVMPGELHDVLEPYIHQLDQPGMDLKYSHHEHDGEHHDEVDGHEHGHDHGHDDHALDPGEGESVIDQLLEQVRGKTSDGMAGLGDLLKRAFENTSPEDRGEFLNNIKSAAPQRLREIATAWRNGRPESSTETPPFDDDFSPGDDSGDGSSVPAPPPGDGFGDNASNRAERQWLVDDVVEAFGAGPDASASIAEVIHGQLTGIPDQVAVAVLRDWQADLTGGRDPAPETGAALSLDARIVHHLKQAGVPLSSLGSRLENRLRESVR